MIQIIPPVHHRRSSMAAHCSDFLDGIVVDARDAAEPLAIASASAGRRPETMSWTAIIPIKEPNLRKTRLAASLSAPERARISHRMMLHVARTVCRHRAIAELVLLSESIPPDCCWSWRRDEGRGLNAELEAARSAAQTPGALIIHADLPLVSLYDIDALIAGASRHGVAIAPDRHGSGTNAIAVKREIDLNFRFGADSYVLHRLQVGSCTTIAREGLGFDLDTSMDLELIMARGRQPLRKISSSVT